MARINNSNSGSGRSFGNGKGRRYALRFAVKLNNGKMQLLNNGSLGFDPDDITNPNLHCNKVQERLSSSWSPRLKKREKKFGLPSRSDQ